MGLSKRKERIHAHEHQSGDLGGGGECMKVGEGTEGIKGDGEK